MIKCKILNSKFEISLVLISRWENILQKVTDSVNNSKVYEELLDEAMQLKDQMVDLNNSTACTTILDENEDLDSRMRNIKVPAQRLKYLSDQT